MKNRAGNNHSTNISNRRWLAYVTAGAATTSLFWAGSAEAEVHYSGVVNFPFADGSQVKLFPLTGRVGLQFSRFTYFPFGSAGDLVAIGFARRSNAIRASSRNFYFAQKLSLGQQVSSGLFGNFFQLALVSLYGSGQFNTADEAFIGFRFDDGQGRQYGWARVKMGKAPRHKFILRDYAYGDVGDRIRAGQRSSNELVSEESNDILPEEGSLGGLALGAIGLLAWRRRRS